MAPPKMRREVKWAGVVAVLVLVLLQFVGPLDRLPWWLLMVLAAAVGLLAANVGDAIWQRRRAAERRRDDDQLP